MKRPWMPLYIADYLADTCHLTATESGAYLHLLMHYWVSGPLPDNDTRLCRLAKVWPPHWPRVRGAIEPFFDITKRPGLWSHHRADSEITKAEEISNKRKGAALQKHIKSSANAEQLHTQLQSQLQEEKKDAPPTSVPVPNQEAELYQRGKAVLGKQAGGLIKKLLAAKGGDVALARSVVEVASTKQDPREYVGAVVAKGAGAPGWSDPYTFKGEFRV